MYRCPVCRTRRKTWPGLLQHMQDHGHDKPCGCLGYHYPHRPFSRLCRHNPDLELEQARDADIPEDEFLELAISLPGKVSKDCPF